MVLASEKSKIKIPSDSVPGESCFPGSLMIAFSLCPHVVERENSMGIGPHDFLTLIPAHRSWVDGHLSG